VRVAFAIHPAIQQRHKFMFLGGGILPA